MTLQHRSICSQPTPYLQMACCQSASCTGNAAAHSLTHHECGMYAVFKCNVQAKRPESQHPATQPKHSKEHNSKWTSTQTDAPAPLIAQACWPQRPAETSGSLRSIACSRAAVARLPKARPKLQALHVLCRAAFPAHPIGVPWPGITTMPPANPKGNTRYWSALQSIVWVLDSNPSTMHQ